MHVDPSAGKLRIARGGVPPPLLWQQATAQAIELSSGGPPLAVDEEPYPVEELAFERDDLLAIATDGLIESLDTKDAQFGMAGFGKALCKCGGQTAQQTLDCIVRERQHFCGSREQADDMTLLIVRRL
jgi:serine phosphatase RsbU (regulator of sigma subunit)